MFAAVPCYNLRSLSKIIASDMPEPRSVIGAWREMRLTWKKQQGNPSYQYETPLPTRTQAASKSQDPSVSELGDLSPKTLK
jgi:fatty acid desaturase